MIQPSSSQLRIEMSSESRFSLEVLSSSHFPRARFDRHVQVKNGSKLEGGSIKRWSGSVEFDSAEERPKWVQLFEVFERCSK